MKKKKHSPEQIITKLRTVDALTAEGATVAEAAKQIGVSPYTVYRWKKQYGGMDRKQAKRLKDLEKENARLIRQKSKDSFELSPRPRAQPRGCQG